MSCGSVKKVKPRMENYTQQQTSVCDSQDDFNVAVQEAVKYNNRQYMKQTRGWAEICSVIWLIFMVWALVLAMKMHSGPKKIEHLVLALLFPPVYVLAYYLSSFGSEVGVSKTVNVGFM